MTVTRFQIKRRFNALGQTTDTHLAVSDKGNLVGYDDYERLEIELHRAKSQLEESLRIHRGSTAALRDKIKSVIDEYQDHTYWPEEATNEQAR